MTLAARETQVRGVVLRSTPYRDTDAILQLFTFELGRISVIARGARASRRRFGGAISSLVLAEFELGDIGKALVPLQSASMVQEWTGLAARLPEYAHATYGLELLAGLFAEHQPEPEILQAVLLLWTRLVEYGPSAASLRWLEMRALTAAGAMPDLYACATCACPLEAVAVIASRAGELFCDACRQPADRDLLRGAWAYLALIAQGESYVDVSGCDEQVGPTARRAARAYMLGMIEAALGHPVQALVFLGQAHQAARGPETS